ncbi:hypothetical protein D5273_09100 [Enterorhabdus caecimuris]|nr:hypothetical protein [Adlercreutzia caecimuris]
MYMVEKKDLEASLAKARKILKVVRVVLIIALILCVTDSVLLSFLIPLDTGTSVEEKILPFISSVLHVVAGSIFYLTFVFVLTKAIQGSSPFSIKYSNWMTIAGILLLLDAIFNSITPGSFSYELIQGPLPYGIFFEGVEPGTIDVDTSTLILAVVVFALSAIFRYGALLQNLSDDLV